MPPVKHLSGLLPQALANLLRPSSTLDHRFKVPQQMRPADLPPPGGIPRVGTPAIRHQDAAEPFAQQLLRDLGATRQADHEDGDPRGDGHPQPRAGASFTPARLIEVRDRVAYGRRSGRRPPGPPTACTVACSRCGIVPRLIGIPNRSAMTSWVVRFDRRYAPVHSATMACTRGPKPPGGTPTGQRRHGSAPHTPGRATGATDTPSPRACTGGTSVT